MAHLGPVTLANLGPVTLAHLGPVTLAHLGPVTRGHLGPVTWAHMGPVTLAHLGLITLAHLGPVTLAHLGPVTLAHLGPITLAHLGPITFAHLGPVTLAHLGPVTWAHESIKRRPTARTCIQIVLCFPFCSYICSLSYLDLTLPYRKAFGSSSLCVRLHCLVLNGAPSRERQLLRCAFARLPQAFEKWTEEGFDRAAAQVEVRARAVP